MCVFLPGVLWLGGGGENWGGGGEFRRERRRREGLHVGRKLTDTSAVHNVHIFFTAALFFTAVGDNAVEQTSTESGVSNIKTMCECGLSCFL